MAVVEQRPAIAQLDTLLTKPNSLLSSSAFSPWNTSLIERDRPSKRVAPGLELRLRRLDDQRRRRGEIRRKHNSIGRIPEAQLQELERLQRQNTIEVRRRGSTWTGPPVRVMPVSGGVRLSGGPVLSEGEQSFLESDVSSVIHLSEGLGVSDTEEDNDDELCDGNKYRMPDIGKTRLHLRTKEPLSPGPRQAPTSPRWQGSRTPTTPQTPSRPTSGQFPRKMDSPRANGHRNGSTENVSEGDFVNSGIGRAGSIHTLSRVSFTGQLQQLTSMRLPDANSLAKRISSLSSATDAAKALLDASEQIQLWIRKASELLNGLNAEDDVEWAAAGGREGVDEVDNAIGRFERLVQVYIVSIERLQTREDAAALSSEDLRDSVRQMEVTLASWQKVKQTLKGIKEQVEIAMEWEELWYSVIGELGQEFESCNRLVFEMEERRHEGADSILSSRDSLDLNELETIVEERPGRGNRPKSNRFSMPPPFSPSSPIQPNAGPENKEDSSLLALFARMQPLRASLDFLPMRLSQFHVRGGEVFPSACLDLENRRSQLEEGWKKLEADAESLRRELGEDRWVLVFRNAGRQAQKMCESVARSYVKLKDALDAGEHLSNAASFAKKTENCEAKKTHYGPAIERVLAIIDRGVLDRLTVNGEILRLQSDMKRRWTALHAEMRDMDVLIEELHSETHNTQLRDSVSTFVSSERSAASSLVDTPGSSPASSVVGGSRKSSFQSCTTPTPLISTKTRQSSFTPALRPASRLPSSSSIPKRTPLTRSTASEVRSSLSPSPSASGRIPPTTSGASKCTPLSAPLDNRPRWKVAAKSENRDFAPLSKYEPSPYAKTHVAPKPYIPRHTPRSTLLVAGGLRTPLNRNVSAPVSEAPASLIRPPSSLPNTGRKSSLPVAGPSMMRTSSSSLTRHEAPPGVLLHRPSSGMKSGRRSRSSMLPLPLQPEQGQQVDGNEADNESPSTSRRPPSALTGGGGREGSLLTSRPKSRLRDYDAGAGALEDKPRWRG